MVYLIDTFKQIKVSEHSTHEGACAHRKALNKQYNSHGRFYVTARNPNAVHSVQRSNSDSAA